MIQRTAGNLAAGLAALALSSSVAVTLTRAQDPPPPPPPDGAAMVQGACTGCHGLDFIGEHRKDRADWEFTVRRMIDKGADLGVDDVPIIVDYLARTFPKPAGKPAEVTPPSAP